MQSTTREMASSGMTAMLSSASSSSSSSSSSSQVRLQELQNPNLQLHFDHPSSHDDFLDQMLSTLPSWTDLPNSIPKSPWDLTTSAPPSASSAFDESVLLASRLRQHQINGGGGSSKPMGLHLNQQQQQQQMMMVSSMARSGGSGLLPLPLSLGSGDSSDSSLLMDQSREQVDAAFKTPNPSGQSQNYGAPAAGMGQSPSATPASGGGAPSSGTAPPRQRVRARRGQATDPHSIAERLRRERIAERMKSLQELVPNANKTDKASMLDEIIDYVKFLQLQVKVLSMSRLGAAAAVAPLVADMSSDGARSGGGTGRGNGLSQAAAGAGGSGGSESMTVTEHQVAKMMEEDMGSAMQYLQGKGLCLMPISLASAISTATASSHLRTAAAATGGSNYNITKTNSNDRHPSPSKNGDVPSSPSVSALTMVQSAMMAAVNGGEDRDVNGRQHSAAKDAASISKP